MMTQFKQNVSIFKWSNDNQITEEKSEHGKNILKTIKSHNNLFTQILLGQEEYCKLFKIWNVLEKHSGFTC